MKSLPVPPEKHSWVLTEDGTYTLHSDRFMESAHSIHGASEETKLRYIAGCQIEKNFQQKCTHNLFEVGFGLGIGFLETAKVLDKYKYKTKLNFISCELDHNLVAWCQENLRHVFSDKYPKASFELLKNLQLDARNNILFSSMENLSLTILLGDVANHTQWLQNNYLQKIDSIFQDPYSPKKNPTLWTKEWFQLLKQLSHHETILSTYSSSQSVRRNMLEAGWGIHPGPGFGKKKSSTIAYGHGASDAIAIKNLGIK